MKNYNRIEYLDFVKAIGIWLMLLSHTPTVLKTSLGNMVYAFHMPLFFIINGYISKYDKKTSQEIMKWFQLKIQSYIIPYFIFALIWCVWNNDIRNIESICWGTRNSLMGCTVSALWFLTCMFLAVCIYQLIQQIIKNDFLKEFICIALMVVGLFCDYNMFPGWGIVWGGNIITYVGENTIFVLGIQRKLLLLCNWIILRVFSEFINVNSIWIGIMQSILAFVLAIHCIAFLNRWVPFLGGKNTKIAL